METGFLELPEIITAISVILAVVMIITAKTPFFGRINAEKLRKYAKIAALCGISPIFAVIAMLFLYGSGVTIGLINPWLLFGYLLLVMYMIFGVVVGFVPILIFVRLAGDRKILSLAILVYSVMFAAFAVLAATFVIFAN